MCNLVPDRTSTAAESDRLDSALLSLGAVVALGAITTMLDMTMVNVALAGLIRTFAVPVGTVQWVVTGYLLAIAMVIPVTGWAVERFGAKTTWLFALAVFMVGSALCGTAWSAGSLIAFRVVQGVGGGMIVPLSMTILAQAAGPHRRGRLMSIVAVPAQVAPIAGPLLGGLILDAADWRWIFYLNVPVCALALALAWRVMPSGTRSGSATLDLLGLALLSPGLAALTYGLYEAAAGAGVPGRTAPASLVLGAALLVAFAGHALRTRTTPVFDLRLFAHRAFAAAAALNFVSRMSIFGAVLLIPLYYQQVRGLSAFTAGMLLAPQSLGTMLALPLVGKLTDRIGARPVVITGIAAATVSVLAYTQLGADTNEILLALSLLVWGAAIAATTVPVMAAAYVGLAPTSIPRATSAITTVQTVGASFGAAVLAVVLQHQLADHPGSPAAAFAATFWWTIGFTALAVLPALFLPKTN